MSFQAGVHQQNVQYQADRNTIENLKKMRSHLHHVCRQHVNHVVRIETIDGQIFTGRIVSCDRGFLYLAVPNPGVNRTFFNPYPSDELILTLVLYKLLVITLLHT